MKTVKYTPTSGILTSIKANTFTLKRLAALMTALGALTATPAYAWDYSNTPLFWATGVQPNVVLLLDDSSSMRIMTYSEAYASYAGTPTDWRWCASASNCSSRTSMGSYFSVQNGTVYRNQAYRADGNGMDTLRPTTSTAPNCNATTGSSLNGHKVSNGTKSLCVRFKEAATATSTASSSSLGDTTKDLYTVYQPAYIQYLLDTFYTSSTSSGTDKKLDFTAYSETNVPSVNRVEAARSAAKQVIDEQFANMRIGLFTFSDGNGAVKRSGCGASADATALKSLVDNVRPWMDTPLAESLYEVTRYYRGLSPQNTALATSAPPGNGSAAFTSPITTRCQKNTTIVLTDGEPDSDSNPFTTTPGSSESTLDFSGVTHSLTDWDTLDNQTVSTYHMDDVAQFGYDIDFFKTGFDSTSHSWEDAAFKQQNMSTYTVAFALKNDLLVQAPETGPVKIFEYTAVDTAANTITINNHGFQTGDSVFYRRHLAAHTNTVGGLTDLTWYYVIVSNTNTLKLASSASNAQSGTAIDITSTGSGNKHVLSTGPGKFYLAKTTDQLASSLSSAFSEVNAIVSSASAVATNSTRLDSETRVYQAKFDTSDWSGDLKAYTISSNGEVSSTAEWETSSTITSSTRGTMLTWNGNNGVLFDYANLSNQQKTDINSDSNVVSWIKGTEIVGYRPRTQGLLGDIINSDPIFVGPLNFSYMNITDTCVTIDGVSYDSGNNCTGGNLYQAFVNQNKTRTPMIYFGANDGQLRGVLASNGTEKVSYVPAGVYADWVDTDQDGIRDNGETIIKKLYNLTQDPYTHTFFVDGSPSVGDAFDSSNTAWKTLLASGLGAGGRTVFALDVTDSTFDQADALWEYSDANLGYTFSRPIIARLQTGDWAVIFGNGYDSGGDKAQLFIVDAFDGTLIGKIDTGVGSSASENGLSSVQVEVDEDRTVTNVYGGDLQGNLWKFDLSSSTKNDWSVSKLFTAVDSNNHAQPITGGIRLGSNPKVDGTMVYFGTGKYFESTDNTYNASTSIPKENSFYGILDDGSGTTVSKSSDLVSQSLSTLGSFRSVSDNSVDYEGGDKGWYVDLVVGTGYEGERVVTTPVLYGGRIIFVSLISENSDACTGGGTSWLYDLDALNGGLIDETPVFDQNGDGEIDSSDQATAGHPDTSGGILSEPTIISAGGVDYKVMGSTSAGNSVVSIKEAPPPPASSPVVHGRMSWRQLQ